MSKLQLLWHDLNRFPSCALNTKYVRSQSLEYSSPARLATCDPMWDCETRKTPARSCCKTSPNWEILTSVAWTHCTTEIVATWTRSMWKILGKCSKLVSGVVLHKGSYLIRIKILKEPPAPQSGCIRVTASYSWPHMSLRTRSYGVASALKLQSVLGRGFHFSFGLSSYQGWSCYVQNASLGSIVAHWCFERFSSCLDGMSVMSTMWWDRYLVNSELPVINRGFLFWEGSGPAGSERFV